MKTYYFLGVGVFPYISCIHTYSLLIQLTFSPGPVYFVQKGEKATGPSERPVFVVLIRFFIGDEMDEILPSYKLYDLYGDYKKKHDIRIPLEWK